MRGSERRKRSKEEERGGERGRRKKTEERYGEVRKGSKKVEESDGKWEWKRGEMSEKRRKREE